MNSSNVWTALTILQNAASTISVSNPSQAHAKPANIEDKKFNVMFWKHDENTRFILLLCWLLTDWWHMLTSKHIPKKSTKKNDSNHETECRTHILINVRRKKLWNHQAGFDEIQYQQTVLTNIIGIRWRKIHKHAFCNGIPHPSAILVSSGREVLSRRVGKKFRKSVFENC